MSKKIVILGAGFGGLHAALKLGKYSRRGEINEYEVVLIDKNDYHTYTPTLYEVATTSKDVADTINLKSIVAFPIRKILKGLPITFVQDKVIKLDLSPRDGGGVYLESGHVIRYEYLVMSLGSVSNDFGIPGLKEFSHEFKTFEDAMKIRDSVWNLVVNSPQKDIEIAIGGGGSTGVELAGELRLWVNQLCKEHGKTANITIIESNPNILNGFRDDIVQKVRARLDKIGVRVKTGEMITSASKEEKTLSLRSGTKIKADIFVWAGGVKPNTIQTMPFKTMKGRIEVSEEMKCLPENPDLSVAGKVFGIGDLSCVFNPVTGQPVPMVARAAITEAKVVADNIIRDINGKARREYKPIEYPYVIPVGGKYAVAKIGRFSLEGFSAWVLKGLVELNYLISIMPIWRAISKWLKGLWIFVKNDRLG